MKPSYLWLIGFALTLTAVVWGLGQPQPAQSEPTNQLTTPPPPTYPPTDITTLTYPAQDLGQYPRTAVGLYELDPQTAPFPFNALVPAWPTDVPAGFHLEIRTGQGETWSDWLPLHTDHDLTVPDGAEQVGQMIFVPDNLAETGTHDRWQLRGYTHDRQLPPLELTFINSTYGPSGEELHGRVLSGEFDQLTSSGYPKPSVVPRSVWCTDPGCACPPGGCGNSCLDDDPLVYRNVTHLIMHHTVSSNSSDNWADVVRAIWSFHALNRCWGDIGYNYLIDRTGVIYEGHRGGDDVVGTHAGGANAHSMGVSLIGTFTYPSQSPPGIRPPEPMLNALSNLLAWKASQKGIDIYGASYQQGLEAGRMNLMGHRDAYGTTECPGQQAHDLIPEIKDRVAQKLNFTPDHRYIDELSPQFSRGGTGWAVGAPYTCGNNSHSYVVRGNPDQVTAWGEWRFNVPYAGRYELEVFTPFCNTGEQETVGARYTVYHAGGQSSFVVNQNTQLGLYRSLGTFDLAPNSDHRLRLTNWTTDAGWSVWFDTIRLRYLGPAATNNSPEAESWQNSRTVNFAWGVTNAPSISQTVLRVATDAGMSQLVHEAVFADGRTSASLTFGQDYASLYWQVVVTVNTAVSPIASTPTRFGLDSEPPTTAVNSLTWNNEQTGYFVGWGGSDNLSGIQSYRIEFRQLGASNWSVLLDNTTQTSENVIPDSLLDVYEFRSMARDKAGNVEVAADVAEISTAVLSIHIQPLSPINGAWVNSHTTQLRWQLTSPHNPDQLVLAQVATEESFANPIWQVNVPVGQGQATFTVDQDYPRLYWRVIEPTQNNRVAGQGYFGVDTLPPVSSITGIYEPFGGNWVLALGATEATSGIEFYTLQFRPLGTAEWQTYPAPIRGNSVQFVPTGAGEFQFRLSATDRAQNSEPWHNDNIRTSAERVKLENYTFLPTINR